MEACSLEWFESLSAFRDGEVTSEDAARIEAHLGACPACRLAASAMARLGRRLAAGRGTNVPDPVRSRAREEAGRGARPPARRARWVGVALVALAAAGVAFVARPTAGLTPAMADELVRHHVGGFARERPCDFESSDPAAVSRWVEGKLGYTVRVEPPSGARLLGARACSVGGTRVAALLFETRGGPLTVFVPPRGSASSAAAARLAHGGVGCTRAALGNAICAADRPSPVLAVAETDPDSLARTLSAR